MGGDRLRVTVGDLVTLQRGTTYKGPLVGEPGPALLGLGSIEPGGGFRHARFKTYGGECPLNLMLYPGDLYVALKGATKDGEMIGSVARVPPSVASGRLTQDTVKLVFKEPRPEHARFLYWILRTPHYRDYCRGRAMGSAVVALSRRDSLAFPVPPMDGRRKKLVDLLEALDDKIELNRRMSETLEAMARALFKSWFVDFDPVRAKAEGRDPGLPRHIADLFPSRLVDSDLGEIPEGWKVVAIRDAVEGIYDGPHATPPESPEGHVYLGIKNFTGTRLDLSARRCISEQDWPRWTRRVTPRGGDIVFTYEATLGFFALVPPWLSCCLGRRTALVRPRLSSRNRHYLFHYFVSGPFQEFLRSRTQHGSTVDRILLSDFPLYPVMLPPASLVAGFEDLAQPVWSTIHARMAECDSLATLRDTSLPMLVSGRIREPPPFSISKGTPQ